MADLKVCSYEVLPLIEFPFGDLGLDCVFENFVSPGLCQREIRRKVLIGFKMIAFHRGVFLLEDGHIVPRRYAHPGEFVLPLLKDAETNHHLSPIIHPQPDVVQRKG